MKNGNFELSVVGGVEDTATGTVTLPHQQTFRIELTNHLPRRRCNVRLSFNGRDAGEFRVPGGQTVVLTRPVNDETPFTFLQVGTAEAKAAGLVLDGTAGVIRARFLPEASSEQRLAMDFSPESLDPLVSKEDAAEIAAAFGLTAADPTPEERPVFIVEQDGSLRDADDIFTFDEWAAGELVLRLADKADHAVNVDEADVLRSETNRLQGEVARLDADIHRARGEFDYDLALDLGRQVRVKECDLLRLEWRQEVSALRRQVEALQAAVR